MSKMADNGDTCDCYLSDLALLLIVIALYSVLFWMPVFNCCQVSLSDEQNNGYMWLFSFRRYNFPAASCTTRVLFKCDGRSPLLRPRGKPSPSYGAVSPTMKILLYIVSSVLLSGDVSPNPGPPLAPCSSKTVCDSDIFKIYSQNVQSLCNKLTTVDMFKSELSIYDVLGFSEVWTTDSFSDSEITLKNYQVYRRDRGSRKGGVMLLAHDRWPSVRRYDLERN